MKRYIATSLLLIVSSVASAEYCNFSREEVSGENKFCFYRCAFGEKVVTVGRHEQCVFIKEFSLLDDRGALLFAKAEVSLVNDYKAEESCVITH